MTFAHTLRTVAIAAIGLGLAACGGSAAAPADPETSPTDSAQTITVQTNNGEMTVPLNPQRVVALDNTSFETLVAMGITPVAAPKQLLPSSMQAWADDESIVDIGTHREPKLELINEAQPDLIVGGKRFQEQTETLSAIAPVIDLAPDVETEGYVDALKAQTSTLGEIFDAADVAEELNAELDAAVERAAALTIGQTVFLANHNGGKIDNGAGRMAPLLQPLTMIDVFAGQAGGSDSVHNDSGLAPETIAQANPDWVIVLDRDAVAAEQATPAEATIGAQEAWANTTFVTKNQIVYLDKDFYVTEGIQAYTAFYTQLADALDAAA